MTRRLKLPMALGLAAALLLAAATERAGAVVYKASLLSVTGYNSPDPIGISGTSIIGFGTPVSGEGGSFLLDDSTHTVVELNPAGWVAQPGAVSGDNQVGYGTGPTTGGNAHAVLWHGTAASLVDLNPAGVKESYAYGVYGNNQVGAGYVTGSPFHAFLWHGSAASVVDLHPAEFAASQANSAFGDDIVGIGQNNVGQFRAVLWQGAAHTEVNLHSAAYPQTYATDVSQDSQVGQAIYSLTPGSERHALLWHGTAASVIDLQPPGFTQTIANGVAGTIQVGYGQGSSTGNKQHALFWQGSAASVFDLHSLLTGLGHTFISSGAADINANGVIVGYASDSSNVNYAVKWTPVVPGDYNGDAVVDAADYTVWRDTLGSTSDLRANGDDSGASAGKIDQADFAFWKTNFGAHSGSGSGAAGSASVTVPEPTTVTLFLLGFTIAGAMAHRTTLLRKVSTVSLPRQTVAVKK